MTATTLTYWRDGDRSSIPFTDIDSSTILEAAVLMLAISRGGGKADAGE